MPLNLLPLLLLLLLLPILHDVKLVLIDLTLFPVPLWALYFLDPFLVHDPLPRLPILFRAGPQNSSRPAPPLFVTFRPPRLTLNNPSSLFMLLLWTCQSDPRPTLSNPL